MNDLKTAIIGGIAGLLTSAIVAGLAYVNKDRELDIEMVRVSLSILAGDHKESNIPGRRFALSALEKFSGVDIPDAEAELWAKSGTLPSAFGATACTNLAQQYAEILRTDKSTPAYNSSQVAKLMQSLGCFPNGKEN